MVSQLLETQTPIAPDERGSGRNQTLAQLELNAHIEAQANAIALERGSGRTFHWYVTVEHPIKGEQGFYLDTLSDRFTDVMSAVKARRLDLGLSGYKFFEAIDLGDLPF